LFLLFGESKHGFVTDPKSITKMIFLRSIPDSTTVWSE